MRDLKILPKGFSLQLPTPIAIIGMGKSGTAVTKLLLQNPYLPSMIVTFDSSVTETPFTHLPHETSSTSLFQKHRPRTLVVSPGIPLSLDWICEFERSGGLVTSELEISLDRLHYEKVVAITGSIGKSTSISLLDVALKAFDPDHFTGGNLGVPLAEYCADRVSGRRPAQIVALEISSFQLERSRNLSAVCSAITSLVPNHLERYESLAAYYETKWALVDHTTGSCFLNHNSPDLRQLAAEKKSSKVQWVSPSSDVISMYGLQHNQLIGRHNLENLAIAASLARELGISTRAILSMASFRGLPHRLENLGLRMGVQFVNDSKATTIESVAQALQSCLAEFPGKKIHLLIGGRDKNLPWENLRPHLNSQFVSVVGFGEIGPKLKNFWDFEVGIFPSLFSAMQSLRQITTSGEVVLLSPGGTSQDEFGNFEERGTFFKTKVEELW